MQNDESDEKKAEDTSKEVKGSYGRNKAKAVTARGEIFRCIHAVLKLLYEVVVSLIWEQLGPLYYYVAHFSWRRIRKYKVL